MREFNTPVFVATCKPLIPKKYFNDKRYFIEVVVFNDPERKLTVHLSVEVYNSIKETITGEKEFRVYKK